MNIALGEIDGEICLRLDKSKGTKYVSLLKRFAAWNNEAEKFKNGEITEDEYNAWRYTYPKMEAKRFGDSIDILREEKKKSK